MAEDSHSQYRHWVDKVRVYREDVLYSKLFGQRYGTVAPLPASHFGRMAAKRPIPPHWLAYGVLTFQPTPSRRSWLYVTSGMSNDWQDAEPPQQQSGLGCEFILETTSPCASAVDQLHFLMAQQLSLALQTASQKLTLGDFDRIPVLDSSLLVGSQLRWLMLFPPRPEHRDASLHSGHIDFYQVVAITEAEGDYARARGRAALLLCLERAGAYPVVDWNRTEAV